MLTFIPLVDIALIFVTIIAVLVGVDAIIARRREKRILSETNNSVLQARTHSDTQIEETRRRNEAYQARIFELMEEHNVLLREILSQLRSGNRSS
jgi:hypothetical protein